MFCTMNKNITKIISVIFNLPENEIDKGFSMSGYEKWDSLAHIKIVMALETEFNIKFTDAEIALLTDIKSIDKLVSKHINTNK